MPGNPNFNEAKLIATDFDNTYALTSQPAPNGMTVERAYEKAVEEVFGLPELEIYKQEGGLHNRAPSEIVAQLSDDTEDGKFSQRTEDLVQIKLTHLYKQVGQKLPNGEFWPRIVPGFKGMWETVSADPKVDTGVVSSGHRLFIEKFHDVHDLELPDHMVTDDDMRPLLATFPREMCVKPSSILLDWIHAEWLKKYNMRDSYFLTEDHDRIVYAGDDPVKDGKLAENYGVEFVHVDPAKPQEAWDRLREFGKQRLVQQY